MFVRMQQRTDTGHIFPELLRAARKRAGKTQQQMADLARVTQAAVSQWESGKEVLLETTLAKYAGALGLSLADLLAQEIPPLRRRIAARKKSAASRRKEVAP